MNYQIKAKIEDGYRNEAKGEADGKSCGAYFNITKDCFIISHLYDTVHSNY